MRDDGTQGTPGTLARTGRGPDASGGDGAADGWPRTPAADSVAHAGAPAAESPAADAPERVVLGIDFSPASLGAARWLAAHLGADGTGAGPAGTRRRLDACLAHVLPRPDDALAPEDGHAPERALRALRPAVLGGLAGFAASLRLGRARSVVGIGRPSAELARVVAADGAGLLVLGRRRDAGRQRVGEPNVIQRVIRRACSDVLVVPEGAPAPARHVLAGVDAGPTARDVLARAYRLADTLGATLTVVHALAPLEGTYERLTRRHARAADAPASASPAGSAPGEAAHHDTAYGWLLRLVSSVRVPGARVAAQLAVASGDAGRALAALAERDGPSVIVVGKRGADGAPPGSLGSVARELVARGPSPVLVVEGGASRDGGSAG